MKQVKERPRFGQIMAWVAIVLGMAVIIYLGAGNTWPF